MTRKRIRYSELSSPPAAPVAAEGSAIEPADALAESTRSAAESVKAVDSMKAVESVKALESFETLESVKADESLKAVESLEAIESFEAVELFQKDESVSTFESFGTDGLFVSEQSGTADEPPLIDQPPPRPKRNSTPVELARTLTAERAAALAHEDGGAVRGLEVYAQPIAPSAPEPRRALREMARRRDGVMEMLTFRVGGERFAVELVLIDEVIDLPIIHHVPEMPMAMIGVVTVRGSLTPVYSPRHALGLPLALRDALLIFRRGDQRVGILIDDVDDAMAIDMSELRETVGGDASDSVLLGVVRSDRALIGIIDAHALIVACQSADILETA